MIVFSFDFEGEIFFRGFKLNVENRIFISNLFYFSWSFQFAISFLSYYIYFKFFLILNVFQLHYHKLLFLETDLNSTTFLLRDFWFSGAASKNGVLMVNLYFYTIKKFKIQNIPDGHFDTLRGMSQTFPDRCLNSSLLEDYFVQKKGKRFKFVLGRSVASKLLLNF